MGISKACRKIRAIIVYLSRLEVAPGDSPRRVDARHLVGLDGRAEVVTADAATTAVHVVMLDLH